MRWIGELAITIMFLIGLALMCVMFYGIAWLLHHHLALGVVALVALCLVAGTAAVHWGRSC